MLEGVAEATAGLSKGVFGKWSDNAGKRLPFVQWGYFMSALSKPMMARAANVVTISVGVSSWGYEDPQELISRADKALYAAKNNGRNRVEISK